MDGAGSFLEVCEDLARRAESREPADLIEAQRLLRRLLLAPDSLIVTANMSHQLPLVFTARGRQVPPRSTFWSCGGGLAPSEARKRGFHSVDDVADLSLDALLAVPVLHTAGTTYNVGHLIMSDTQLQASTRPSVGTLPSDPSQIHFRREGAGDVLIDMQLLAAVSRIVLKGVQPLVDAVSSARATESQPGAHLRESEAPVVTA
jgi:hypothetical protein